MNIFHETNVLSYKSESVLVWCRQEFTACLVFSVSTVTPTLMLEISGRDNGPWEWTGPGDGGFVGEDLLSMDLLDFNLSRSSLSVQQHFCH